MRYLAIWIALLIANLIYAWMNDGALAAAVERSWFQGVAVLAVWWSRDWLLQP